jgi:hypothetical protein
MNLQWATNLMVKTGMVIHVLEDSYNILNRWRGNFLSIKLPIKPSIKPQPISYKRALLSSVLHDNV